MTLRPPISTLFPYTTLFRSYDRRRSVRSWCSRCRNSGSTTTMGRGTDGLPGDRLGAGCRCHRSEEHTSELQSQSNLVCRLLLEKKKHSTQQLSYTPTMSPPP